jgi:hypothetical protein
MYELYGYDLRSNKKQTVQIKASSVNDARRIIGIKRPYFVISAAYPAYSQ